MSFIVVVVSRSISDNIVCACFVKCGCGALHSITFTDVSISGLFSPVDGITPKVVDPIEFTGLKDLHDQILEIPSLIRVLRAFGLATYPSIEVISLVGALAAFLSFVSSSFCIAPTYAVMWLCYYSLVGVTGTFHSQADDLLLEGGAAAFMLAAILGPEIMNVSDNIFMLYMRWVLFR